MNRRSPEPFLWMLFSSGGMVAALMVPILLFLFGIAIPLDLWSPSHDHLLAVLRNPLTRLVLFGLCALALFHWAHRFRYTLYDGLQLKRYAVPIVVLCYGGAVVGSVIAAGLLLTV
ncbi:fumarate reductase subunit FrdD [Kribbella sindirgiensis]|uniref:Fumarate reductase subunit D n=1 Tax=Kribbella sindirgiensis TaxID=1124744 RepID=A0A4R0IGH2_9ACTN|nr:fumarate reductase subunit FrdD [Kribbella sindirgiensis]TCC31170.1 fumarate reductase subunit D [Kribbella sindirgiensis]